MKRKLVTFFSSVLSVLLVGILGWTVFADRILPNTYVGQTSFGRLTLEEATERFLSLKKPQEFVLIWGTSKWKVFGPEINFNYLAEETIKRVFVESRIDPFKKRVVGSAFVFDKSLLEARIASISASINVPAQDPEVNIVGQQILVSRGENGLVVDSETLKQEIYKAASTLSLDPIEIPVKQIKPRLNDEQVQLLFEKAKKYLGKKIKLTLLDKQADIDATLIASWMGTDGWKRDKISAWVSLLAISLNTPPQSALFHFTPPNLVKEFLPGKDGIVIDEKQLLEAILKSLDNFQDISVPYQKIVSPITTESVNNLGIKELLGRGESYYSDSIANREFNVAKAASTINGLLVPPGETFSFNKYVGDISAETGYKQAYVIKDGKTVLGDGGGVCQVSSTLFRAVLAAGLPIEERLAHAYRVHYYEENSQVGLDATVFAPDVDFKFTNDTQSYILIQSNNIPAQKKLLFDIYGTNDGRTATVSKSRVWDITAPPPDLYVDDPTLARGVIKQMDWKAWGAKAAFDWKVVRGEEVLQERNFYSNYRPWQAVYLRGTR